MNLKYHFVCFFHLDVGWTFIHNYGGIVDFEKRGGKNVSVVFERG